MDNLTYEQMHDENDIMIPKLKEIENYCKKII